MKFKKPFSLAVIRRSCVMGKGKIQPWGTIRIQDKYVPIRTWDLWSQGFLKYAKSGHKAQTAFMGIEIIDKKGQVISEIDWKKIFYVSIWKSRVGIGGYLFHTFFLEGSPPLYSKWSRQYRAFYQALRGQRPRFLDNSGFIRVSRKFIGRKLIVIHSWLSDDEYLVFTQRGERVRFRVDYPLSYAKWELKNE